MTSIYYSPKLDKFSILPLHQSIVESGRLDSPKFTAGGRWFRVCRENLDYMQSKVEQGLDDPASDDSQLGAAIRKFYRFRECLERWEAGWELDGELVSGEGELLAPKK